MAVSGKRSDNMIVGTGIDIIEIGRMKDALSRFEDRLRKMLFTPSETEYCLKGANRRVQAVKFAGRFAAKEAYLKAIGTGLRDGIKWTDIEILNDDLGKPYINVKNIAMQKLREIKGDQIHISISHCLEYATAVVILEQTV